MLIYRHHTADDIIDMNDRTGQWVPVVEDEEDPIIIGQMSMAQRADFYIRGSYTIEDDKRFYCYWTDDGELVFRTDFVRLSLFQRGPDGAVIDLMPDLGVDLQPATYGDGRLMPNMSTFTISAGADKLVEVLYHSGRYLEYYLGNYTFVPDEDLSDWDFFVAVKRGVEELKTISRARVTPPSQTSRVDWSVEEIVTTETGKRSPRAGIWAASHHLNRRRRLEEGEVVPDVDGANDTWVWISA